MAASDIVVASRDARFFDPHVMLGLVAGDGRVIGLKRAKRRLLTESFQAPEFLETVRDLGQTRKARS